MNPLWLLRMTKWLRRPASADRVKLVFCVVALCLALYGIEYVWGWPEWLTVNGRSKRF